MHVTLALEAHDCLQSSHCPTESFVRVAGAAVSTKARAAVVFRASGMGARRAAPGAAIAMAATHDAIATNSSQRRTKHSQPNQQLRRKTKRNRRTYKERARTSREREREKGRDGKFRVPQIGLGSIQCHVRDMKGRWVFKWLFFSDYTRHLNWWERANSVCGRVVEVILKIFTLFH